jgi:L-alanine-DL-glutamate epimerase-like enolase superfamily enzyme
MSLYPDYRKSRTSWGINVLGSIFLKLTASDGTVGFATGFGGPPACWLIEKHFSRFVVGSDPRDTNRIWDQMFKASIFYGRKGITMAAISVVDLALWDLQGKIRKEPVYKLIGGRTKVCIHVGASRVIIDKSSGSHPILLHRTRPCRCQAHGLLGRQSSASLQPKRGR